MLGGAGNEYWLKMRFKRDVGCKRLVPALSRHFPFRWPIFLYLPVYFVSTVAPEGPRGTGELRMRLRPFNLIVTATPLLTRSHLVFRSVSLPDVNPEQQAYWFHLPIPRYFNYSFNLDFNLLVCSFLQGHEALACPGWMRCYLITHQTRTEVGI